MSSAAGGKHEARWEATEHALAFVLEQSSTLAEATPQLLGLLCESLGWELGELWSVDRSANVLRCAGTWQAASLDAREFLASSGRMSFHLGVGLPGRVWQSAEAAWIPDAVTDPSFLRADIAAREGLHGAAPSLPEVYIKAIEGAEIGPRAGSCGTAMYWGQPIVVTDILTDPLWDGYRDLATPHGLRACWSTPILSLQAKVLGSFAMYYPEPRGPSPAEKGLIDIATHIAGIAIERRLVEDALRASEEKYRSFFEEDLAANYVSAPDGRLLACNPSFARTLGFDGVGAALQASLWSHYTSREGRESFLEALRERGRLLAQEHPLRRKDGSVESPTTSTTC